MSVESFHRPARCIGADEEIQSLSTIQALICGYVIHEGDDMTFRQISVLLRLADERRNITALAKGLNLSNSTTSRIVDALEKQRYAVREREGKTVWVSLTQKGLAKVGRLMAALMQSNEALAAK